MLRDSRTYLFDILQSAEKITSFTANKTYEQFSMDDILSSAVERQFEIIGEALSQLAKYDPDLVKQIPEYQRIIAFRNVLIHGYAGVDSRLVWGIVESKLSGLLEAVHRLLNNTQS